MDSPKKEEQEFFGRGVENMDTINAVNLASPKEEMATISKHQVADQVEEVPFEEEEAMTEMHGSQELVMNQEEDSPVRNNDYDKPDHLLNSMGEETNVNVTASKAFSPTI